MNLTASLARLFLGYPLLVQSDLPPAECERRLRAYFGAPRRRPGAGAAEFVILTTLRRPDLRAFRLYLVARSMPDGGGTTIVGRHTACIWVWLQAIAIVGLLVGVGLLLLALYYAVTGWPESGWPLVGLPLVVYTALQLYAPFTARARQEREAIGRYLAGLLAWPDGGASDPVVAPPHSAHRR
jgi:hypothetical protein